MQNYVEEYRGYTIRSMGDSLNIYDKNGCYVNGCYARRADDISVCAVKEKIDEIISRH